MTGQGIAQIVFYAVVLIALGYPLGVYMARVYAADDFLRRGRLRLLGALERGFLRLVGVGAAASRTGRRTAKTVLVFSVAFFAVLYVIQRLQGHLFLNPDHLKGVPSHISLNTAASFVTNTNWQFYGGEYTMSYLTQMAGLAVQNFVSAAVGMAVLSRSCAASRAARAGTIGNFWRDLYRSLVYILLPLAIVLAVILISQGVSRRSTATRRRRRSRARSRRSPAARPRRRSRSSSSARTAAGSTTRTPPCRSRTRTASTNFLEMLGDPADPGGAGLHVRQDGARATRTPGWCSSRCSSIFVIGVARQPARRAARLARCCAAPASTSRRATGSRAATCPTRRSGSARRRPRTGRSATTDASNGSVNGGFDAQTPAGGAVPLVNLFLGEVIFGGVGSGLYGMFFYIVIAVFVAGLMVGRTPEWLGKKIEAREIKLAALGALFVPTMVLDLTAIAIVDRRRGSRRSSTPASTGSPRRSTPTTRRATTTAARSPATARRTSRPSSARSPCYLGRFVPLLAALALGGSLAAKKIVPASAGTFRTDGPTFVVLLVGVIVLTAGLMIFPALTLGPIVEGLMH